MGKKKPSRLTGPAAASPAASTPAVEAGTHSPVAASAMSAAAPTSTSATNPAPASRASRKDKEFLGTLRFSTAPLRTVVVIVAILFALRNCWQAYLIRLYPVQIYGYLIHEFDPWFNYRATEYMSTHGWTAFFRWFDYMSWYPLGRPVGSTTYPGLQFTAVAIHRALAALGVHMSLNDVCVLIPAWFGSIATALAAAATYEMTGSGLSAVIAAYSFMILPAHLMRSMAGEFDNECIALAAMLLVFYLWMRSLRTAASWPLGALVGVAYGYMVAAWGGYTFVLNMVALHAGVAALVDWARNTYNPSLLRSYALFYVVGTALATRVPPVGMAPFRSLELLGALVVLVFLCGLQVCEVLRRRADVEVRSRDNVRIRVRVFGVMAGVAALAIAVLAPTGYFGPLSSRVRALFVQHTRTGNPLVDSVAEHQPADILSYLNYLSVMFPLWLLSFLVLPIFPTRNLHGLLFLFLYGIMAYYFSTRMVRLLILAGPTACLGGGIVAGTFLHWSFQQLFWDDSLRTADMAAAGDIPELEEKQRRERCKGTRHEQGVVSHITVNAHDRFQTLLPINFRKVTRMNKWATGGELIVRIHALLLIIGIPILVIFFIMCHSMAGSFAGPRIVFVDYERSGRTVMVKDYLESYEWLRMNTPEDARVLSWWDYGYQITGIGNRTTLADGNTWNHEHIATIGKMLTSPVAEAHSLVRHMADYVLIWAGQGGDLGKSPHMARIGNSVYHDICPGDPLCRLFRFEDSHRQRPSTAMRASLLYNLHEFGVKKDVKVDPALFREVYTSTYGLVRIYKVMNVSEESKRWIADPANRVCNPPGSWICPGQYPPAKEIQDMLAHRVDFEQLENFNRKRNNSYYEAYMARSRMAEEEEEKQEA